MLLINFIVELKIMNGSIGEVKEIVYKTSDGLADVNALPSCLIIKFPNSKLLVQLIPDKPNTWLPIPVFTDHSKRKCCSIKNIHLCV